MNEKPIRPICLEYEDTKTEIITLLNEIMKRKTVPLFLLENILSDALTQISIGAKSEREQAKIFYEQQLAKCEKEGD